MFVVRTVKETIKCKDWLALQHRIMLVKGTTFLVEIVCFSEMTKHHHLIKNHISGLIVSVDASSVVDRRFKPRLSQTNLFVFFLSVHL